LEEKLSFLIGALKIIFLLGFLIFIHEGAHFLVAKKCNIEIREFSIGFGPKIFQKSSNGILYSIRLIPFGGFVDLNEDVIEENSESSDINSTNIKENNKSDILVNSTNVEKNTNLNNNIEKKSKIIKNVDKNNKNEKISFVNASKRKRFAVTIAGIVINLIFGFFIYFILNMYSSNNVSTTINYMAEGFEEKLSMLQSGDEIIEINGHKIHLKQDIDNYVFYSEEDTVVLTVNRNGEILDFVVPLTKVENEEYGISYYQLGIYMKPIENNFENKLYYAFWKTVNYGKALGENIKMIFKGNISADSMVGPIGISEMIVETNGVYDFLYLMSVVSVSLGITNLLPIPGLDGGRLLLIIIEAIRRKPLKKEFEVQLQLLGFSFLILLSLFIAYNDVVRIL
jgi:regulator of sigma E protease